MFDKYILCEDSLKTTSDDRRTAQVQVRMPYYRGLGLSMVEAVDISVDGRPVPASATTFTSSGRTHPVVELPSCDGERWEMGEPATIGFTLDEPLAPGPHDVEAAVVLRVSYMPVPSGGRDTKTFTVS